AGWNGYRGGGFTGDLVGRFASGLSTGLIQAAARGGQIDFASITGSAFGNALGWAVADQYQPRPSEPAYPRRVEPERPAAAVPVPPEIVQAATDPNLEVEAKSKAPEPAADADGVQEAARGDAARRAWWRAE